MSGQVSRGSAGEYQADDWAGIARTSWRLSVKEEWGKNSTSLDCPFHGEIKNFSRIPNSEDKLGFLKNMELLHIWLHYQRSEPSVMILFLLENKMDDSSWGYILKLYPNASADTNVGFFAALTQSELGCGMCGPSPSGKDQFSSPQ